MQITKCRICESSGIHRFLQLGATPPANSFVKPEDAASEVSFPLELFLCSDCGLVQLGYTVPPEALFRNYLYFSSTSETLKRHFAALAEEIMQRFVKPGGLVVEIGSNDGVLLRNFAGKAAVAIGFEPATNVAEVARAAGVETINDFFNSSTAAALLEEKGPASAIVATNVFAHIAGLKDLVKGMQLLLGKDGVVIVEFHHLASLYSHMEFDSIYHEHLCYYSMKPIQNLFGLYGMEVFDVKKITIHGGSLRVYAQKIGAGRPISPEVQKIVDEEEAIGLYQLKTYERFAGDIAGLRDELLALLRKLKSEGKRIAGYGAPAKCTTLLNYFGIGPDLVEYIVDRGAAKQNRLVPGVHIPIVGPEKLQSDRPDYLLLLAWNLCDEIVGQQEEFRKSGGKFIVPIPKPRII